MRVQKPPLCKVRGLLCPFPRIVGPNKHGVVNSSVSMHCRIGYPIIWGFCEGSDYATVSTEAICYGTLDFFAKVVFGWIVIVNLDLLATGSKDGRSACA